MITLVLAVLLVASAAGNVALWVQRREWRSFARCQARWTADNVTVVRDRNPGYAVNR